ncbi:hypothetical protein DL93DRAFT_2085952 [Clavulina sp. PMI_390]|nr:hypothetical protein DL93DRAFT_2085952 [Clavulina sp. PMI_390]
MGWSLMNIKQLCIDVIFGIQDSSGTILTLDEQIIRLLSLCKPLSAFADEYEVKLDATARAAVALHPWLFPQLAHIEFRIITGKELAGGAFNGVGAGDPGYETDASADGEYHDSSEDSRSYFSVEGPYSDWMSEEEQDLVEYYENSDVWDSDAGEEDEAAADAGPNPGDGPAESHIPESSGESILFTEENVSHILSAPEEQMFYVSESLRPGEEAPRMEPTEHFAQSPSSQRPPARVVEPNVAEELNLDERNNELTEAMDEGDLEEDMFQTGFQASWPKLSGREYDTRQFVIKHEREGYGYLIRALFLAVESRIAQSQVAAFRTITVTAASPNENDYFIPPEVVDLFGNAGVMVSFPQ